MARSIPGFVKRLINVAAVLAVLVVGGLFATGRLRLPWQDAPPPKAVKKPKIKKPEAWIPNDPAVQGIALSPRRFPAIDVHEHLKGEDEAERLLAEMDRLGIRRTALMASTTYTLTLDKQYGFEGFKENGESILAVSKKWPDRFSAFVTIDPLEEGNLAYLQDAVARGAAGLKLYLGHGAETGKGPFHVMPLNDPRMEPIYAWAEQTQLPIVFHVNLNKYWDELVAVLEAHPYLRVDLPHYGLHKESTKKLARLSWLLQRYPNVYTDISFGHPDFELEGFESLSANPDRSRAFYSVCKNKIMFATDMVLEPSKSDDYIHDTLSAYMAHLEQPFFRFPGVDDRLLRGLALPDDALKAVYETAAASFLLLDAEGHMPDRAHGAPSVPRAPIPAYADQPAPSL